MDVAVKFETMRTGAKLHAIKNCANCNYTKKPGEKMRQKYLRSCLSVVDCALRTLTGGAPLQAKQHSDG